MWLLPGLQVVLRYSLSRRVVRTCVRPLDATHLRRGPLWGCCETLQATTGSARSVLNSSILRPKATKFEPMYPIRSLAVNVVSSFAAVPLWRSWLQVQVSPKDSRWSAFATWFSRSRPCDRLLHKSSENSPLSASGRTPSANSVPGSASGMDDQFPWFRSSFCLRHPRERHRLIRLRA